MCVASVLVVFSVQPLQTIPQCTLFDIYLGVCVSTFGKIYSSGESARLKVHGSVSVIPSLFCVSVPYFFKLQWFYSDLGCARSEVSFLGFF